MGRCWRAGPRTALLSFTRPWRASYGGNNVFAYTCWPFVPVSSCSMGGMPLGLSECWLKCYPKRLYSQLLPNRPPLELPWVGALCCSAPAGYPGELTSLPYWGRTRYSIGGQTWLRLAAGSIWCPHWFKRHNYVIRSKVIGAYFLLWLALIISPLFL